MLRGIFLLKKQLFAYNKPWNVVRILRGQYSISQLDLSFCNFINKSYTTDRLSFSVVYSFVYQSTGHQFIDKSADFFKRRQKFCAVAYVKFLIFVSEINADSVAEESQGARIERVGGKYDTIICCGSEKASVYACRNEDPQLFFNLTQIVIHINTNL
jgi:hypothetical protein